MNYREGMKNIRQPIRIVAGRKDRVAALSHVRLAHEMLWNSVGSEFAVVDEAGHLDLALGYTAPQLMQDTYAFFEAALQGAA